MSCKVPCLLLSIFGVIFLSYLGILLLRSSICVPFDADRTGKAAWVCFVSAMLYAVTGVISLIFVLTSQDKNIQSAYERRLAELRLSRVSDNNNSFSAEEAETLQSLKDNEFGRPNTGAVNFYKVRGAASSMLY